MMATYTISNGETNSYTVADGQSLEVEGGGISSASVIESGGVETVDAGGLGRGDIVSGTQVVLGSGSATGTVVSSGGLQDVYGAAYGTTVVDGGTEIVEVGGTDRDAVIVAGTQTVSGSAMGASVSRGMQEVYGTATSTTVRGGIQTVSGGIASATTVIDGQQAVTDGAKVYDTIIDHGSQFVAGSGVATNTVISKGSQVVFAPGVVSGTRLYESKQYINGSAFDTTVGAGSFQNVYRGGSATSTTVEVQGYQFVDNGCTATGTVLAGGEQVVHGAATGTTIGAGSHQYVMSDGTISGSVIAGGTLVVSSGATTAGPITFAGPGALVIADPVATDTSNAFAAEIDGLAAGDTVDLTGFAYKGGTTSATVSGSVLTVTNGAATETFALGGPAVHYVSATADIAGGILLTAGAAPALSGLAASTSTTGTAPVMPFAGATVTDLNDGGSAIDTLTIVQAGSGTLSSGETVLPGTAGNGTTTYMLSGTAADLTARLRALSFTPAPGTPNTSAVTTFALTDTSAADARTASATTSVVDTTPPVAPTVVGGGAATTAQNLNARPFTSASVGDLNANSTDTLSIRVNGGGMLSGSGLGGGAGGVYTLSGTARQVTTNLRGLIYTPAANPPGTTTVTTFTLTDTSTAGTSASDGSTTVTDVVAPAAMPAASDPAVPAPAARDAAAPATPDAVSLSPQVGFDHGTFTLTGTVSTAVGVRSVELSAIVDGERRNLGAAEVDPDGTFVFQDRVGDQQTYIQATLTDGAGRRAVSADPGFSLAGGLGPRGLFGRQDSFSATQQVSSAVFRPDGSRILSVLAPDQTVELRPFDEVRNRGQGGTTFVFEPGDVYDVVRGFKLGGADHSTLRLPASDFRSFAEVIRNTSDVDGSAVITDPNTGDQLRLQDFSTAQLKAHPKDFSFGP